MSPFEHLAVTVGCGYCGARPEARCVTKSGKRATWPHLARTWPMQQAWSDGYYEGRADVARSYRAIGKSEWETQEQFEQIVDRAIAEVESR